MIKAVLLIVDPHIALQYAGDPSAKAMAEAIFAAQEKEIAEMQAWLAANKR